MLKVLLITACMVLLNGCPFLPPNPYHRSIHGDYPPGYIAISPGQSVEGSAAEEVPGSADIIGVSSELNGELLTATFHLRELPEEAEYSHEPGHFRLETNHWLVLVSIEGDPLTPMSHLDYMFQATYYDPKKPEMVVSGRLSLWLQEVCINAVATLQNIMAKNSLRISFYQTRSK